MENNKVKKFGILFLFFLLVGGQSTQAQFWKKVKERVKDGVEEAVLRKTEEKATKETEKAIDSIFETPKKIGKKNKKGNTSAENTAEEIDLHTEYHFEWKYALELESEEIKKNKNQGTMKMVYLLSPDSPTFGSQFNIENGNMNMGNMLMIMNPDTGSNIMLMEVDGKKIIQRMPNLSGKMEENKEENEDDFNNYTIEKTDTKEILGYTCQGFRMVTDKGVINSYIAINAPISFSASLSGNSNFKPKGFNPKWIKELGNGLMMEMIFISSKKKKHNMKMTCVELVKEPFTVNISEYKSFMDIEE